jgi:putative membrane protein
MRRSSYRSVINNGIPSAGPLGEAHLTHKDDQAVDGTKTSGLGSVFAKVAEQEPPMKMLRLITATAVLGMVGSIAWAQTKTLTGQDFAATAASSDMFEIRSSEVALQKSQTAAVKEFAQMMINDHTKASKELMAAAQQDGVTVPAEMTEKHATQILTLKDGSAASFDASYIKAQLAAHEEALNLMTSYAQGGDGKALKAHAQKTAPVIQMHLEHVQQLNK